MHDLSSKTQIKMINVWTIFECHFLRLQVELTCSREDVPCLLPPASFYIMEKHIL